MIRLFIGCAPNAEDAESQSVVEYSVRKNCSLPINLTWLRIEKEGILSGWNTENWATPFTGFRYAVPEMCGFEGRAIYVDSDFIFLGDLANLWEQSIPDEAICLARSPKRMCIILWNCEKAKQHLPPVSEMKLDGAKSMKMLFGANPNLVSPFEGNWNCIDGENFPNLQPPDVLGLHMSHVPTQPHMKKARARLARRNQVHWYHFGLEEHPRRDLIELFERELNEADANGYAVSKYVEGSMFGQYKIAPVTWEGRYGKV